MGTVYITYPTGADIEDDVCATRASVKVSSIPKNIYGLDRNIPESIRRQIRQDCGFGCVVCGCAVVQYEHIDPPFSEATAHEPDKIALLCGSCHDRVTRGIWSKDKILGARRTPKTFKQGFTKDAFDFTVPFELFVGDNSFKDVRCVVRKDNDEWLSIEPPEAPEGPPRLNAKFFAPNGEPALEICQNEWRCPTDLWDLKIFGPQIEVWTARRNPMLRLKAQPPHGLQILSLDMQLGDAGVLVSPTGAVRLTVAGTVIEMKASDVNVADAIFSLP